jgi:glutamate dehydrogenase
VPAALARQIAACSALQCAPDIVELAHSRKMSVDAAAAAYFGVGSAFGLDWLRSRIESLDTEGHWHAVARGSLREALYETHRGLVQRVLDETRERDAARALERWQKKHAAAAQHARGVVNDIQSQPTGVDYASLSVALQAVRRLVAVER